MIIDSKAPESNAFTIMGLVRSLLKQVGRIDEWDDISTDMMSGDFSHLCGVAYRVSNGSIKVMDTENDVIIGVEDATDI